MLADAGPLVSSTTRSSLDPGLRQPAGAAPRRQPRWTTPSRWHATSRIRHLITHQSGLQPRRVRPRDACSTRPTTPPACAASAPRWPSRWTCWRSCRWPSSPARLGIRAGHRRAGPAVRDRHRPALRRCAAAAHLRPAGAGRHRLRAAARPGAAPGRAVQGRPGRPDEAGPGAPDRTRPGPTPTCSRCRASRAPAACSAPRPTCWPCCAQLMPGQPVTAAAAGHAGRDVHRPAAGGSSACTFLRPAPSPSLGYGLGGARGAACVQPGAARRGG